MAALQCFEAVARHLSATRAAEELHLTQSAVSKQIAQLEGMLQRELFSRIRKRLQLTPAGELYLTEIKKILTHVEMSSRYILSYGADTEVLTVAAPPSFGSRWLIPGLKGFGARHPTIHLDIRSESATFDTQEKSADVVFFFGEGTLPGAECIALFGEELVAVCAPDVVADAREITITELANQHVLLQCTARPEAWRQWFLAQDVDVNRSYRGPRFQTFDMCICAARAGCGIAMVPRLLAEQELRTGHLVLASDYAYASTGAYYVAYAEHTADTPKVRALVQWVIEKAAAHNS